MSRFMKCTLMSNASRPRSGSEGWSVGQWWSDAVSRGWSPRVGTQREMAMDRHIEQYTGPHASGLMEHRGAATPQGTCFAAERRDKRRGVPHLFDGGGGR
jgi:hypothetical protein